MGVMSTGMLTNPTFKLNCVTGATENCYTQAGSQYLGGLAAKTKESNALVYQSPVFPPGILSGLFDIRIYYTADLPEGREFLYLDIYEDGELKYGDIEVLFSHSATETQPILKLTSPFKEGSSYSFDLRTGWINGYSIILDHIRLLPHGDSVLMTDDYMVNSEGEELIYIEQKGALQITGNGTATTIVPVEYPIPFYGSGGGYVMPFVSTSYLIPAATNRSPTGFDFSIRHSDNVAFSSVANCWWICKGYVEGPIYAP